MKKLITWPKRLPMLLKTVVDQKRVRFIALMATKK